MKSADSPAGHLCVHIIIMYSSSGSDSSTDSDDVQNTFLFMLEEASLHDECVSQKKISRGGSKPGRAPNKDRHRQMFAKLLQNDFWGPNPVYDESHFRRTFRMPKALFNDIHDQVVIHDDYFKQKLDACKVCFLFSD